MPRGVLRALSIFAMRAVLVRPFLLSRLPRASRLSSTPQPSELTGGFQTLFLMFAFGRLFRGN